MQSYVGAMVLYLERQRSVRTQAERRPRHMSNLDHFAAAICAKMDAILGHHRGSLDKPSTGPKFAKIRPKYSPPTGRQRAQFAVHMFPPRADEFTSSVHSFFPPASLVHRLYSSYIIERLEKKINKIKNKIEPATLWRQRLPRSPANRRRADSGVAPQSARH